MRDKQDEEKQITVVKDLLEEETKATDEKPAV